MYDIIIIGSGPGGFELALNARKENLSVALIEKARIGGTCLNHGCIPTKTLRHEALLLDELRKSSSIKDFVFDYSLAQNRKKAVIDSLRENLTNSLRRAKVDIYTGTGMVIDSTHVSVNDDILECKYIVVATGSKSRMFPMFENNKHCYFAEQLLEIAFVPQKLTVVGGGVIGLEMACLFHTFGSEVTIIETQSSILGRTDLELVKRLQIMLIKKGIKIITSAVISACVDNYLIVNDDKIISDLILVAVGREANTSGFGLDKLGLALTERGYLKVDQNFMTSISNIYAIGDANGKMMLAHYATYNSHRVLNSILGRTDRIDFEIIPSCVFTIPELASIGKTEEACAGMEYKVHKSFYRSNGKAVAEDASEGIAKIIVSEDLIIGAHILGKDSNVLIHEILAIMNAKIPFSHLKDYIHAHPTLSEVLADMFK